MTAQTGRPSTFTPAIATEIIERLSKGEPLAVMCREDIGLLKALFKAKMQDRVPGWLKLITHNFNDKDVDGLIEHFRDKERRKEFFKEYKEIEMLYEIISPDAYLRPFIEDYTTVSKIYLVVRNAYAKRVYVDRDFQKKTNALVQEHVGAKALCEVLPCSRAQEAA